MISCRAKRLVWGPSGVDGGFCAECIAGTYVIRPAHDQGYEWWLCIKGVTHHVATIEQAKAASQADFDCRWMVDTETADAEPTLSQHIDRLRLEWRDEYADRGICTSTASTPWGVASVSSNHNGGWQYRTAMMFHPCDSIDDGKAKCLADYQSRVRAIFGKGV